MPKTKPFQCSDDTVNTYGFRVLTDGIDTTQFARNPVMLYDHGEDRDYKNIPIGRWEGVQKNDGLLLADPVFDTNDTKANAIKDKVDNDFIRMASVGLIPIEWSNDPKLMLPGQTGPTLVKSVLREISITPFGSNLNALRLYDENGGIINLNDYSKIQIPTQMDEIIKSLIGALSLSDKASSGDVVSAVLKLNADYQKQTAEVAQLKQEKETLQKQLDEAKEADKQKLLSDAVKAKRITEKEKEVYAKLSIEDINTMLADRTPATNLGAYANQPVDQNDPMLKMSWSELDRADKLAELKEKHPDVFKDKYKAEFGTEYKG